MKKLLIILAVIMAFGFIAISEAEAQCAFTLEECNAQLEGLPRSCRCTIVDGDAAEISYHPICVGQREQVCKGRLLGRVDLVDTIPWCGDPDIHEETCPGVEVCHYGYCGGECICMNLRDKI